MNSDETFTFKTRRKFLLFILVGVTSIGRFTSSAPVSPCPEFCECFVNKAGIQSASCAELPSNATAFPNIHDLTLRPPDVGAECHIPEDVATIFPQLNFLQLKNCSLTYIPSNSFRELKSLEEIDLSNNFLRKFSHSIFSANGILRYVNLRNNPLNISNRPLLSSHSILELDLSSCNISKLSQNVFKSLSSLKYLTLSNNMIKSIKENTLPSGLKMLILVNNNVTNVPISELNRLTRLRELDLSRNPINCTCELMAFQNWVSGKGMIFLNPIECVYPKEYAGRKLLSLPQYDMCDAKVEKEVVTADQCTGPTCQNQILQDEGYAMDQPSSDAPTNTPTDSDDFQEFINATNPEDNIHKEEGSGDYEGITDTYIPDTKTDPVTSATTNQGKLDSVEVTQETDAMNSTKINDPSNGDIERLNGSITNTEPNPDNGNSNTNSTASAFDETKQARTGQFNTRFMIPSLLFLAIILTCFSVYFSQHNCRVKDWMNNDDPKTTNNTTEMHQVNLLSPDPLMQNGNKYSSKYPSEGQTGQTEKLMNGTEYPEETVDSCRLLDGQSATKIDVPEPIQSVKAKVTNNPDSIPKTPTIVRKD